METSPSGPKYNENFVYISLPETMNRDMAGFELDPSVLMPVEIRFGTGEIDPASISWEMIIAAMLKTLAWDPLHKDAEYYRHFILALRPGIENELYAFALSKIKNRSFDIAEETLTALTNLFPGAIKYMINLAVLFHDRGSAYRDAGKDSLTDIYCSKAHNLFSMLLETEPENSEVLYNSGIFYLEQKNYEKANRIFSGFLIHSSDLNKKAKVRVITDLLDEMEKKDARFKKIYDMIILSHEDKALDDLDTLLKKEPSLWNTWFLKGWALRRLCRYEEAFAAFKESLALYDKNPDTYNELAICSMELQLFDECRNYLETGLKLEPQNSKFLSNLGILNLKMHETQEALACFRSVLENNPDDVIAERYMELLQNHPEP